MMAENKSVESEIKIVKQKLEIVCHIIRTKTSKVNAQRGLTSCGVDVIDVKDQFVRQTVKHYVPNFIHPRSFKEWQHEYPLMKRIMAEILSVFFEPSVLEDECFSYLYDQESHDYKTLEYPSCTFISGFIMEGKSYRASHLAIDEGAIVSSEPQALYRSKLKKEICDFYNKSDMCMLNLLAYEGGMVELIILINYLLKMLYDLYINPKSNKIIFDRCFIDHISFATPFLAEAHIVWLARFWASVLPCRTTIRVFENMANFDSVAQIGYRWPLKPLPGREFEFEYYSEEYKMKNAARMFWKDHNKWMVYFENFINVPVDLFH